MGISELVDENFCDLDNLIDSFYKNKWDSAFTAGVLNDFLIWDKRQEEILKKVITSNKNLSFSIVGPIPSFNINKK